MVEEKKKKKRNISLRFLYENSFKIELRLLQEAEALSRQAEAEFENTLKKSKQRSSN